ncbi:MAG TPA: PEGA domain-containing protein [Polyangiales bacterium]
MTLARTLLPPLLFLLFLGFGSQTAWAQPMGKVLVVPFMADMAKPVPFSAGRSMPADEARQLEQTLARRHATLLSLHEAHDRFLARSRVAQQPNASDIDQLAKEAQAAIQHVALGRTSAAQHSVQQIIALAERSLETLNRETATARGLLDACLALVRASLHDDKRDEAIDQAMRCRRLVPDLAPSDVAHPATVVGALAEADDQLRRMRVGSLRVSAEPERGCEVYLNGRHLGHTPFTLDRAPAGAYRVQVECAGDSPGRVHWVELGDDPVTLSVDGGFDSAIQTEPRLALRYRNEKTAQARLVAHAARLARDVRADEALLIGRIEGRLIVLRVLAAQADLVAGVRLDDTLPATYAKASQSLAEGRFEHIDAKTYRTVAPPLDDSAAAGAAVAAAASAPPGTTSNQLGPQAPPLPKAPPATAVPPSYPEQTTSRAMLISGGVLAGLGVGSYGAAFGLYAYSLKLRDEAEEGLPGSSEQQEAQQNYEDYRLSPLIAGILGLALSSAAVPLLLPKHPPRSTAGWVGGALAGLAGVAAITAGALLARDEDKSVLGGVLVTTGVPLLVVPITQLVRAARARAEHR